MIDLPAPMNAKAVASLSLLNHARHRYIHVMIDLPAPMNAKAVASLSLMRYSGSHIELARREMSCRSPIPSQKEKRL